MKRSPASGRPVASACGLLDRGDVPDLCGVCREDVDAEVVTFGCSFQSHCSEPAAIRATPQAQICTRAQRRCRTRRSRPSTTRRSSAIARRRWATSVVPKAAATNAMASHAGPWSSVSPGRHPLCSCGSSAMERSSSTRVGGRSIESFSRMGEGASRSANAARWSGRFLNEWGSENASARRAGRCVTLQVVQP